MGRKNIPGLVLRAGTWHIDKRIRGRRICQSTGTADLIEAQTHLARVMEETRQAQVYGVRPKRTFEQAAVAERVADPRLQPCERVRHSTLSRMRP